MQSSCPACSPGQLGGKHRHADMSTAKPVLSTQLSAWMPAFSSRGLQSSPKACSVSLKVKWAEFGLMLKIQPSHTKRSALGPPHLVCATWTKSSSQALFAAVFCVRLKQAGFFLVLWKSHKRGVERWKKQPEESRETKRQERERKRLRGRKVKERAVSTVKGTGGVSSPSQYKEVVWEGGCDR